MGGFFIGLAESGRTRHPDGGSTVLQEQNRTAAGWPLSAAQGSGAWMHPTIPGPLPDSPRPVGAALQLREQPLNRGICRGQVFVGTQTERVRPKPRSLYRNVLTQALVFTLQLPDSLLLGRRAFCRQSPESSQGHVAWRLQILDRL